MCWETTLEEMAEKHRKRWEEAVGKPRVGWEWWNVGNWIGMEMKRHAMKKDDTAVLLPLKLAEVKGSPLSTHLQVFYY